MVRLRHRYLVTEYSVTDGRDSKSKPEAPVIRSGSFMECLNNAIKLLHGVQGVALCKAGLLVKYVNNSTNILLIRMRRSAFPIVSSALPYVKQVNGRNITLRTLYTGATIKNCNLFLIKYQRKQLEERYGSLSSDVQRSLFEQELTNVKEFSVQIS